MAVVYISMCFMLMIRFMVYTGETKKKKKKKKPTKQQQTKNDTYLLTYKEPGRVAQSVGHLTRTRSGNILSFLLPLFQGGQLSVTGESVCTKYWLTA